MTDARIESGQVLYCSSGMPRCNRHPHPGDLTRFLPLQGHDGGKDPYRRGDDDVLFRDPLDLAPPNDGVYGAIYFGYRKFQREMLLATWRALDVDLAGRDYVAYRDDRGWPQDDGYMEQIRLVGKPALTEKFAATDPADLDRLPTQEVTIGAALSPSVTGPAVALSTGRKASPIYPRP